MNKASKRSPRLLGRKVHLVFGFTGGGTEYLVGVFAALSDAKRAAKDESQKGRTTYVETKKIR